MTCAECRELLLEAELDNLLGEETSPTAAHFRECPDCQRMVEVLRAKHEAIRALYLEADSRVSAAEVLQTIGASAGRLALTRTGSHLRRWALVGLGTAALVALAVLPRRRTPTTASDHPPLSATDTATANIVAQVPPDHNAIIFITRDPLISVVWIY